MKRKILSLVLGVLMVGNLFACQSTPSNSATDEGNAQSDKISVVVELNVLADENSFDVLEGMIASFKQKYAGEAEFNITLTAMAESDVKEVMLGNIHEGADVFQFPDDQLNSLIAGGVLSAVPNSDEVKAANIEESVNAASLDGTLYAYPMTADNGYFLYYDKRYLTEEDVKTMDGILAVAQNKGKKVSMELNAGWYLYSFFGNTGLQLSLNEDGVTNYCNWNTTEGSVTGMDIGEAIVKIVSNPAFVAQVDDSFISGVKNETVIAGISGVWNAATIKEAWGEDYGAVKLPTYTCNGQQIQMASFTGYKMVGVNSYSENVEWAHKFADWITNEENQQIRFTEKNMGPSNINVAASDEVGKVPAIAAVIDQSHYGVLQRVGNNHWAPCVEFADNIVASKPTGEALQTLLDKLVKAITASVAG